MLGGFCLDFLCGAQVRHQSKVDAHAVAFGKLPLQLAHGLNEGEAFHIANRAANLGDNYIILAGLAEQEHPALDFIRDMGHNLDGLSKVCALAFTRNYGIVNAPGGDVVGLGGGNSQETLVMAQIKVGLGPVVGHVAFPVFVGIERSRIYIDVRVKFLDCDAKPAGLQKLCQRGCNYAFSQRRNHAAGDENVFCTSRSSHNDQKINTGLKIGYFLRNNQEKTAFLRFAT